MNLSFYYGVRMAVDKKHILFAVAFILLAVSILYRALNPFEQDRIETLTYTGEKRLPPRSDIIDENRTSPRTFHDTVSRFTDHPRVSAAIHQDLFSIYQPPRLSPSPETLPENPLTDSPVGKPEQNRQDLIQEAIREISGYRIFGIFEDENKRFVFLSKGDQIIVAGEGDRLEDKFRVDEIEKTHVKIMALHVNESLRLEMSDLQNG